MNFSLNEAVFIFVCKKIKKNLQFRFYHFHICLMSQIALIGKKLGMTNIFDGNKVIPVTVVKVLPNVVVDVRKYSDKSSVVLAGNDNVKETKVNKPQRVQFSAKSIEPRETIKEFVLDSDANLQAGTKMEIGDYLQGAMVDVRSRSIGKGFQGGMKRWGFGGLPASHGVSVTHRSLGSTGNRTLPGRVFKGKKMAGHMGDKNICVQNLKICTVDTENSVIAICGSIPGKKNTVVYITSAVKKNSVKDNNINGLSCEG